MAGEVRGGDEPGRTGQGKWQVWKREYGVEVGKGGGKGGSDQSFI